MVGGRRSQWSKTLGRTETLSRSKNTENKSLPWAVELKQRLHTYRILHTYTVPSQTNIVSPTACSDSYPPKKQSFLLLIPAQGLKKLLSILAYAYSRIPSVQQRSKTYIHTYIHIHLFRHTQIKKTHTYCTSKWTKTGIFLITGRRDKRPQSPVP